MRGLPLKIVRGLEREAVALAVARRWQGGGTREQARPHGLGGPLVLSLTSYAPRFGKLALTLKSLLMQTIRPDATILWLAEADRAVLPHSVRRLEANGLSIRTCADVRSYKKIIPTLAAYPDATIVTADDDAYYWPSWLEELVAAIVPERREILCHRAHGIVVGPDGAPRPYGDWRFDTDDTRASMLTFPTGLGGTLYRPGLLPPDTVDRATFERLCPTADDVWLFWMASRNGATFRKVGPRRRFVTWRGTQRVGLFANNLYGASANDSQIAAMVAAYGFPPRGAPTRATAAAGVKAPA